MIDADSGRVLGVVPPPAGTKTVDDLAVADHFLFVLDGRPPGHLSVFSLEDRAKPVLASPPIEVAVGPSRACRLEADA